VGFIRVTPRILLAKYGAGDFENANAIFIFPGNIGKAILKTKRASGYRTGPVQPSFEQRDISLPAASARSFFKFLS
jgi:hypothetical protein